MSDTGMTTNRRAFIAAGGAGAIAMLGLAGRARAAEEMSAEETAGVKVVNDFCEAWATKDAEKIVSYMDENASFQMFEAAPIVKGREVIKGRLMAFLASSTSAEFEVLRTHAIGKIVINERIDHFVSEQGERAFHVTGVFYVNDGKIVHWYDYMYPGAEVG